MAKITNKIRELLRNILSAFIVLMVGISLIGAFTKSKKGMFGNIIGGFVVIFVSISLMGTIAQEINNAYDCNGSSMNISLPEGTPTGETDSFGGGGAAQFGGYDGVVKHNKFIDAVASTSIIKTNESVLNPDCIAIVPGSAEDTLIKMVPGFFIIGVLLVAMTMIYTALSNAGLIGGSEGGI